MTRNSVCTSISPSPSSWKSCSSGIHARASGWNAARPAMGLRFSISRRYLPTLFEITAAQLGIRHKFIRPYAPRRNGKVEYSRCEGEKRFYTSHSFFSLNGLFKQVAS